MYNVPDPSFKKSFVKIKKKGSSTLSVATSPLSKNKLGSEADLTLSEGKGSVYLKEVEAKNVY